MIKLSPKARTYINIKLGVHLSYAFGQQIETYFNPPPPWIFYQEVLKHAVAQLN
jgi:hypothetical protein